MIQKDIDTTLFSIFNNEEVLFNIDNNKEWIMYQLGNISDTLVVMYIVPTHDWYFDDFEYDKKVFVLDTFELDERKTNPLSIIGLNWIYTFWKCTWKEVHTKEEMLEALKKLKVKFKLFNINSDFE